MLTFFFLHQLLIAIQVLRPDMKYLMLGKKLKLEAQRFMELLIM